MATQKKAAKKAPSKKTGTGRGSATRETANVKRVEEFLAACERLDGAALGEFFDEKAVYHNIPLPPIHGKKRIEAALSRMMPSLSAFRVRMLNIAANGDAVLTERIDTIEFAGTTIDLPVSGTFVFENGKIIAWRDYFDMLMFVREALPGLPRMIPEVISKVLRRQ